MSFVSAIFLFALPLIGVPIAIHLYRGRQRDTIPWGAMQFLAEAVTKGRRMERLEEFLLMLLRVGTVLALILALAQPMLRSSLFGSADDREVVLILDNSLSMARTIGDESASDQMKKQAKELIEELGDGDRVQILLACGGPQWLTLEAIPASIAGKQQLNTLLEQVTPTLADADLLASMQSAVHLEPDGDPSSRRIVLLTDNQRQSWSADAEQAWQQLHEAARDASLPTSIETVNCGFAEEDFDNLAVTELEALRVRVRPGESINFTAVVANVGDMGSGEATVEWLVDSEVVETSNLKSLESGGSTQVVTSLPMPDAGVFAVTCTVNSEDQIVLDQSANLVVEVSDHIPILIVHDLDRDFSQSTADKLLSFALGYDKNEALKWHSVYEPEVVSTLELPNTKLADYRAVIITNLGDIDGQFRERLIDFVKAGGGLWMALGDRVELSDFNRDWYDDGQGTSPMVLQGLRTGGQEDDPASMIHPPSQEHPATTTIANTTQLDIDQARVYEYWQLSQPSENGSNVSVLVEAGDGSPLVVEKYLGQGRALIQAFPIGLEQSNLPQLKCFLVMVQDWLDYITAPSTARYNVPPGSAIVASPLLSEGSAEASVQLPNGTVVPLVVQEFDGRAVARYSQTQLPGLYRVSFMFGDDVVANQPFQVARDPAESSFEPLAAAEQEKLASLLNLDAAKRADAGAVEALPRQKPLWGMLLGALVLMFGSELLLSHVLAQQRSGVAVTTS